jgi:hypothetical protein
MSIFKIILMALGGVLILYALYHIAIDIILLWCSKKLKALENLDLNKSEDFIKAAEICYGKIQEVFDDVTLLIVEQYAPNGQTMIYDFSRYEDLKVVGLTAMHNGVKEEDNEEGRTAIVPHQKICRFEDGTLLWVQT